jgi:hypothetical protein
MIPPIPGTYALVLRMSRSRRIRIGRLGAFNFPASQYISHTACTPCAVRLM